jgi:PAS domain S-box-containing protein
MFSFGLDRLLVCARLALGVLCCVTPALALAPDISIDQYGHDFWTSQNGLPGEAVYEILQTPDGYLWLRMSAGLVRFDGVRFVLVEPVVANKPVNEPVKAICKSADGNLLIRTTSRTILYKDGVYSDYLPPTPLPDGGIRTVFESREHEVFVGTDDFIYVIRNGQIKMLRRGIAWVNTFLEDEHGLLWIGTSTGLYTYRNGVLSVPENLSGQGAVDALIEDREHNVWAGTVSDGLYRMNQARSGLAPVARDAIHGEVFAILEDRQENLWLGTISGLLRLTRGRISSFNSLGGLTDSRVFSLYEDREGSIWVGTSSGLDRFRDTNVTTFTSREGLPSDEIKSVIETRDGSLYVFCNAGGLGRIKNGVVTAIPKQKGVPDFFGSAIFESRDGSLWLGPIGGLTRYKGGKFTVYAGDERLSKTFISAINEDEESLIATTSDTVALRFKDGKVGPFTFNGQATPLSKPGNYTFTIYRDPAGTLWFGTVQGLFKFARGESPENARQKQINFPVTSISDDQRGSLWLGSRTPGLIRFRIGDGRVTRYTKQAGLFDDYTSRVLTDDDGNLWVSTSRGIYMVSRKELEDFDGGGSAIRPTVYGTADGMKTSEASDSPSQPGGWRTRDGKLWFATKKGVVVIDPKHLLHNDLVPPVVIESVVADGDTLAGRETLETPPGKDRIEFHYTSLSLLVPDRVRFKYKLDGYDRDWVDAGSGRVAYYTNLRPGRYRFRVIGSNNDGVWNNVGASTAIYLKPHIYQTTLFYSFCVMAIILCAIAGQRLYTLRLRIRAEELTRLVDQRTQNLQQEINERVQAEAALMQERSLLRTVIDLVPDRIYLKDVQSRFILGNRATVQRLGAKARDDFVGKTDFDFYPQEIATPFFEDEQRILKSAEPLVEKEESCMNADASPRWTLTTKIPLRNENGQLAGIVGIGRDITQRKLGEQALRDSQQFLNAIIDNSLAVIYVKDLEGRYILVNKAFEDLFGAAKSSLVGKTDDDLFSKEQAETLRISDQRAIASNGSVRIEDSLQVHGRAHTYISVKSPLHNGAGKPYAICGVSTDITELKLLEDQLRQAQKMEAVGQFAGGIAHDFNGVLTANLGYSELIMRRLDAQDPIYQMTKNIRDSSLRGREITRRLLAFTRRQVLDPRALHLNAVISGLVDVLHLFVDRGTKLVRNLDSHLRAVKADPHEVEQVIINLVSNASDAMCESGTLTLSTSNVELKEDFFQNNEVAAPGPWVVLEVSDTGCGMDSQIMAHVFEPFFTTKDPNKGTGLGLAMVDSFVRQWGGLIRVHSEVVTCPLFPLT